MPACAPERVRPPRRAHARWRRLRHADGALVARDRQVGGRLIHRRRLGRDVRPRHIELGSGLAHRRFEGLRVEARDRLAAAHLVIEIGEELGDLARQLGPDLDGHHSVERARGRHHDHQVAALDRRGQIRELASPGGIRVIRNAGGKAAKYYDRQYYPSQNGLSPTESSSSRLREAREHIGDDELFKVVFGKHLLLGGENKIASTGRKQQNRTREAHRLCWLPESLVASRACTPRSFGRIYSDARL